MEITTISEIIKSNLGIVAFYLPIGIIGFWRWGVWMFRKFVGFFYRQPKGNFQGSLAIITPVYNENPVVFARALNSWKQNEPDEIIAVIDSSNNDLIELFRDFSKNTPGTRLIVTDKPGKRPALADGISASHSDIVALVDSDTVWSSNIKKFLIGPFSNPKLGGLVPRQDVMDAKTPAQKIFKIHLANRYLFEFPFLAAASNSLTCLSGRTAVYRRSAIESGLNKLVNEKFLGKQMISGDDKSLTNIVQSKGWHTTFLRDVKVFTTGVPGLASLLKQELRWARNALRSDLKILFSGWLWKRNKMLLLHMLDKFVQPITLLLAPIYFIVSLMVGLWQGALVILIWWLVSRTVKIFPYLRENPKDITILPLYVLMTFATAVIRIYALLTVDQQGWITRWDKSRLFQARSFDRALSYLSTSAIMIALFFVVFSYKNLTISNAATEMHLAEKMRLENILQSYSITTPDLPILDDSEFATSKAELLKKNSSDQYGYYVVKAGDMIQTLQKRYNLAGSGRVLDATTKAPLANVPLRIGQKVAVKTSDLQNPISKNITAPNPFIKPPRVTYDIASNTIFVRQGGSVANLSKIRQSLGINNKLLEQTARGEWILRANLYVGKNVTLVLDSNEVTLLKLRSDDEKFVWIRTEDGNMLISNTKITSWDESISAPDQKYWNGRAFVTAKSSGRMDIINSDLGYLGYVGLPKRGGEFGGSYGVSWKIENNSFRNNLLTGVVTGSKFHNNFFGLYTYGATGMLVKDSEFYDNVEYGLDPHDDSNNFLIENNRAYGNGKHGIILSRRCFNNVITGNTSHGNKMHGIMLDRDSNNNLLQKNTVYENTDGIAIYGSNENILLENEVRANERGIRMNVGSMGNYAEGNKIDSNSRGIYVYDQANKNMFFKNEVKGSEIGITIKNASDNILFNNFKTSENKHDGRITADATGNNIQ